MSNVLDKAGRVGQRVHHTDVILTEIFKEHFGVDADEPAGKNAYALLAVDVAVSIANIFLSLKNPDDHRHYRAICDTTYHLNTNDFWTRNASVLLPIMHVGLNTWRDGVELMVERTVENEYAHNDGLILGSRAAPLEIFPVIAYLVGGPALMVKSSLPLKKALAPYFLG